MTAKAKCSAFCLLKQGEAGMYRGFVEKSSELDAQKSKTPNPPHTHRRTVSLNRSSSIQLQNSLDCKASNPRQKKSTCTGLESGHANIAEWAALAHTEVLCTHGVQRKVVLSRALTLLLFFLSEDL